MIYKFYIVTAFYLLLMSCNDVRKDRISGNLYTQNKDLNNSDSIFTVSNPNSFSYDCGSHIRLIKSIYTHSSSKETYLIIDIDKKVISDTSLVFKLSVQNDKELITLELHNLDSLKHINCIDCTPNSYFDSDCLKFRLGQIKIKSYLSKER